MSSATLSPILVTAAVASVWPCSATPFWNCIAPLFIVPLAFGAEQGVAKSVQVPGLSIPKSPLLSTVGPVGEVIEVLARAAKLETVPNGTAAGFEYANTFGKGIKTNPTKIMSNDVKTDFILCKSF